jgi:hypothetical protein
VIYDCSAAQQQQQLFRKLARIVAEPLSVTNQPFQKLPVQFTRRIFFRQTSSGYIGAVIQLTRWQ